MDYQPLYHKLFNACTDALEALEHQNFGQARDRLMAAQQEAEDACLSQTDSPEQAEPQRSACVCFCPWTVLLKKFSNFYANFSCYLRKHVL